MLPSLGQPPGCLEFQNLSTGGWANTLQHHTTYKGTVMAGRRPLLDLLNILASPMLIWSRL
jgi:hypothetical protein